MQISLKEVKNNWTVKDFQKPKTDIFGSGSKGLVFDYNKIRAANYPCILIMTARGGSKTTQIKIGALNHTLARNDGTIFKYVKNMREQTAVSISEYLDINLKALEPKYQDVSIETSGKGLVNNLVYNDVTVGKIVTLKDTVKLTDTKDLTTDIIIDEANRLQDGRNYRSGEYVNLFNHLINSSYDINNLQFLDQRYWFLCNKITTDFEPLRKWQIRDLNDGVTTFNAKGKPFLLVISQKMNENEVKRIKKENANNIVMTVGEVSGTAEHDFFNQSLESSRNVVHLIKTAVLHPLNWLGFCHIAVRNIHKVIFNKQVYEVYKLKLNSNKATMAVISIIGMYTIYIKPYDHKYDEFIVGRKKTPLGEQKMHAIIKQDVVENSWLRSNDGIDLKCAFANNSIAFENESTRANFVQAIEQVKI